MMKTRRFMVIASLVLVSLLITTGVVFALGMGAVNQGRNSTAEGDFSTVSGGRNNNIPADGDLATISGGVNNTASGDSATISGGTLNNASETDSTISGGTGNEASGKFSTVSGGDSNAAIAPYSTIGGGSNNVATCPPSPIFPGSIDCQSEMNPTIGGGSENTASNFEATIAGGGANTASGSWSTIPGGLLNTAQGDFSLAAGRRAKANHNGAFVWADSTDRDFASTGANQFLIRASGGVGIGTNNPNQLLVVGDSFASSSSGKRVTIGNRTGISGLNLGEDNGQQAFIVWRNQNDYLELGTVSGGSNHGNTLVVKAGRVGIGTTAPAQRLHVNGNVRANQFLTSSSQRWKTNIQPIEGALEKVKDLRGVSYDWKADGKHDIGLIAEEVGKVIPEVVAYEANGKDATAVDYAKLVPVLVEAVKEQQQLLEDKDTQIASLQARMTALEMSLGTEANGVQTGLLPFSTSVMWMMAGGLGLLLVTPGLVLGYHRIRREE